MNAASRHFCIIDRVERDRWVRGDRHLRAPVRRILRGRTRPGGLDRVRENLCLGFDKIGVRYTINPSFRSIRSDDIVCVLGRGRQCLDGYELPNRIIAGVGLMTHPSEWPTLFDEYPVARYLQHSSWAQQVYARYFGDRCVVWPVGIDTDTWRPEAAANASRDFLIYDKIRWDRASLVPELLDPIRRELLKRDLGFEELRYGEHEPATYRNALARCRAMIFLCEHESQGLACQEALACGVPVLAWDPGECLDPNRFRWGMPYIPATSVPYWDERCGEKFAAPSEFADVLDRFLGRLGRRDFAPRDYITEHLTLERCAQQYVDIAHEAVSEQSS